MYTNKKLGSLKTMTATSSKTLQNNHNNNLEIRLPQNLAKVDLVICDLWAN